MEWGQGAEPRPGSPCLKETLESRTGAFSGDPDASFSPVLTPGLLPKAGAGTCLGEGHTGGALLLGAKSEAKVMSLFRAPLGVKGPTRASAILPPKVGAELIPSGGFSLKHLPHVRGRVSWSCPCTSKICALQNRERPAHCWGWGERCPSTGDRELAVGDVPLTRLAFALSAAFEPAAPSAAAGVGGMENAVSQWRTATMRTATTIKT